ncbi:MAG: hypothetical protein ACLP8S_22275 [Solirubrobacteraceae bacterium]
MAVVGTWTGDIVPASAITQCVPGAPQTVVHAAAGRTVVITDDLLCVPASTSITDVVVVWGDGSRSSGRLIEYRPETAGYKMAVIKSRHTYHRSTPTSASCIDARGAHKQFQVVVHYREEPSGIRLTDDGVTVWLCTPR